MSATRRRHAVACLTLTLALAACGGEDPEPPAPAGSTGAPLPVPADAAIAAAGVLELTDLGTGWRSAGPLEPPDRSPCPVAPLEALPAESRASSERLLEDPDPPDDPPVSLVQRVYVLGTLADADAAFAGQVGAEHLDCVGRRLAAVLQSALTEGASVQAGRWQPLEWPDAGDRTEAAGLEVTLRAPDGTTTSAAFAAIVAQRGRALTVLEVSWLRPDLEDDAVARAFARAVRRLDPARAAPDDRAAAPLPPGVWSDPRAVT